MNSIFASLLVWLLSVACFPLLFRYFFPTKQFEKEPSQVSPLIPIPFIGHAAGLIMEKMTYYDRLSKRYSLPIFTVVAFGGRVYVVNAPDLAVAVFRNVKTLSFTALAVGVVGRVSLLSKAAVDTVSLNANGSEGDIGYTTQVTRAIHSSLAPGEALTVMTRKANMAIMASMDRLTTKTGSTRIKMFAWMKHEIAMATTGAVYGPHNPFCEPSVMGAFWDFERDFTKLLVGFLSSWTAPRGYRGRELVQEALEAYFVKEGQKKGSRLVQERYEVAVRNQLSLRDTAKLEASMAIGILGTTAPASFWMLYSVFSQPSVLTALRTELANTITTKSLSPDSPPHRILSTTKLLKSCPLFSSTWDEMLRHYACSTSARLVEHDTLLAGRHLLRAGAVIQMPSRASHLDRALWGPDAHVFNAARFLNQKDSQNAMSKLPAGAFRPFSGGTTLCPGRHLAAAEILAMVAIMLVRFDLTPANGASWADPKPFASSVAAAIYTPANDPEVDVTVRKGFEEGTWAFASKNGNGEEETDA